MKIEMYGALKIRPYQKDDKIGLLEIFGSAYFPPPTTENMIKQLKFALSQHNLIIFVAEYDELAERKP